MMSANTATSTHERPPQPSTDAAPVADVERCDPPPLEKHKQWGLIQSVVLWMDLLYRALFETRENNMLEFAPALEHRDRVCVWKQISTRIRKECVQVFLDDATDSDAQAARLASAKGTFLWKVVDVFLYRLCIEGIFIGPHPDGYRSLRDGLAYALVYALSSAQLGSVHRLPDLDGSFHAPDKFYQVGQALYQESITWLQEHAWGHRGLLQFLEDSVLGPQYGTELARFLRMYVECMLYTLTLTRQENTRDRISISSVDFVILLELHVKSNNPAAAMLPPESIDSLVGITPRSDSQGGPPPAFPPTEKPKNYLYLLPREVMGIILEKVQKSTDRDQKNNRPAIPRAAALSRRDAATYVSQQVREDMPGQTPKRIQVLGPVPDLPRSLRPRAPAPITPGIGPINGAWTWYANPENPTGSAVVASAVAQAGVVSNVLSDTHPAWRETATADLRERLGNPPIGRIETPPNNTEKALAALEALVRDHAEGASGIRIYVYPGPLVWNPDTCTLDPLAEAPPEDRIALALRAE